MTVTSQKIKACTFAFPWRWLIILLPFVIFAFLTLASAPHAYDWSGAFHPAIKEMLAGRSPYNISGFYNPPWALLPLIPFAVLPDWVAGYILAALTMLIFAAVAYRLGASPLVLALLITSPSAIHAYRNSNLEGLVALGFLLPPQIGLFFVLLKPQIGLGIAAYWLFVEWRKGGPRQVFVTFAPVTVAFLLSFAVYGNWLARPMTSRGVFWDYNFWPLGIPIGVALLVSAIRNKKAGLSLIASPFLAPYVAGYSWSVPILGLAPYTLEAIAAVISMWAVHYLFQPLF